MTGTALTKPKAPPLKTQGIKTRLTPFIAGHARWERRGRWVEPFLGSGAVLFNIAPSRALVADTCAPVIDFYRALQSGRIDADSAAERLRREGELLRVQGAAHYYRIRERFNESRDPLDFLFLNRSCFNGLMRFNRQGRFNTAFCRKPARFSPGHITRIRNQVAWASGVMRGRDWEFVCADWRDALSRVDERDFIYADPPYAGRTALYYNEWREQDARDLAQALRAAPAPFLLSVWVANRFRRNPWLAEWFAGCEIATFEHYYHLGATRSRRHAMTEGLVIGPPPRP